MSTLLSWDIQQTLSAHLNAKNIAEGRIYDRPPPSSVFPYVVLGEDQMKAWNSKTTKGYEVYFLIHVFSKDSGRAEAKKLTNDILDCLETREIAFDHFTMLQFIPESIQTFRDESSQTCQSTIRIAMLGVQS